MIKLCNIGELDVEGLIKMRFQAIPFTRMIKSLKKDD